MTSSKICYYSYRYCSSLPSGGSPTALVPYWTMLKIDADNWMKLDMKYLDDIPVFSNKFPLFQCRLLLPLNAPLREELVSKVMPSKRLARQEVALQACIGLHRLGELDDQHLLPLSKNITIEMEDDEILANCDLNAPQENDFYPRGIAHLFDEKLVPPCYLYLITYKLVNNSAALQQERPFDPNSAERRLGFLSSRRIPPLNPFGIFSSAGQIDVGFEEICNHVELRDADIELCHRFQQFVFENILELSKDEQYNHDRCSYLVVPMNSVSNQIDLDFIHLQLDSTISDWHHPSPGDNNFYQLYHDAVVIPQHDKTKEKAPYYYVNAVCHDLTPLSTFLCSTISNKKLMRYFDYYSDRYNTQIKDLQQPLLEVTKESFKSLNFLTPKLELL